MRFGFLAFFTFLLIQANAQKAQKVEKFYDYLWKECDPYAARFYSVIVKTDSCYDRMDYFIQEKTLQMTGKYEDPACTIRNGQFFYFHPNKVLQSKGKYVHGKKEGLWMTYHPNSILSDSVFYVSGKPHGISLSWHPNGFLKDSINVKQDGSSSEVVWFDNGKLSSAGIYNANNKQIGKWKYYHRNGNLSSIEIYKDGGLVGFKYFDENGLPLTDSINNDSPAKFQNGNADWQKFLDKYIYFPTQYRLDNITKAIVVVSFSVSEEGNVEDIYVSTPFYPAFDKLAENAVKKSPKWQPAISHNRKVKTNFKMPITFLQRNF